MVLLIVALLILALGAFVAEAFKSRSLIAVGLALATAAAIIPHIHTG